MESADRSEVSLDKLRSGDAEEWEKAYPLLWEVAWRTVSRVCPHSTDSEKEELAGAALTGNNKVVVQITNPTREAFVKATSFNDILNLTAAVVRNTTIDEIRKRSTRDDEANQERVEGLFGNAADPADETAKIERHEFLAIAVGGLRENYQQVIEDYYFLEMKTEEIANKRGRPKGTITVELSRARAELATRLVSLND